MPDIATMKQLLLRRFYRSLDITYGALINTENMCIVCMSFELGWRYNERDVSCIPQGVYLCTKYKTNTTVLEDQMTYQIRHVSDRHTILFHIGNTVKDTEGCPLTGMKYGRLNKKHAILDSKKGFEKFMEWADGVNEFSLRVEDRC